MPELPVKDGLVGSFITWNTKMPLSIKRSVHLSLDFGVDDPGESTFKMKVSFIVQSSLCLE